jgi:hypothetical protein
MMKFVSLRQAMNQGFWDSGVVAGEASTPRKAAATALTPALHATRAPGYRSVDVPSQLGHAGERFDVAAGDAAGVAQDAPGEGGVVVILPPVWVSSASALVLRINLKRPVAEKVDGHPVDKLSPQGVKEFRAESRALDKAMKDWEPVAEDAARKRPRGPLAMVCQCVPPRVIRVSSDAPRGALGPDIVDSVCGKPFRLVPGQRKSEADRV